MRDPRLLLLLRPHHPFHPGSRLQHCPHRFQNPFLLHGNMRHLVVYHRKSAGSHVIQNLTPTLLLHLEPPLRAHQPIERNSAVHSRDPVLGQHQHLHAAPLQKLYQIANERIHFPTSKPTALIQRPVTLQIVIEIGQIHEIQIGTLLPLHPPRTIRDPLRGANPSRWPPKSGKRKLPECRLERGTQTLRVGGDIKKLRAIGAVNRPRSHREIYRGTHVVPPKQVRDPKTGPSLTQNFPHLGSRHQTVRLFPKMDLSQPSVMPTVGYNPVNRRPLSRQVIGLRSAGHRRKSRPDASDRPLTGPSSQSRHLAPIEIANG